jgi:acyl-CoA synthetase (NDP forming)
VNTATSADDSSKRLEHILRPRAVVILGMSSNPNSPSRAVLKNLVVNGFSGRIYLAGRSAGMIDGYECFTSVSQLPRDLDLAIITLGAGAVRDAVTDCVAHGIKSAICFASGFAEMGDAGRREQLEIGRIAREGGLVLLGPNCVGYFNYVDSFVVMLVELDRIKPLPADSGPAVAVIAQSGGIGAHIAASLVGRDVPVSYMVTTGNEANIGLAEFVEYLASDTHTAVVLVYAEQVKNPSELIRAVRRLGDRGKHVAMLHPGKSQKAQAAAASHTGALAGDHVIMRTVAQGAGICVVDTLEELIDIGQLLLRFPKLTVGGLGVITSSGALCAIAEDYCEGLDIDIPPLSAEQTEALRPHLPEFTPPRNPLDLGTLIAWQPDLVRRAMATLVADPAIGNVLIALPYAEPRMAAAWAESLRSATAETTVPFIYVVHNEGIPIPDEAAKITKGSNMVVMRSSERAMRALGRLSNYGRHMRRAPAQRPAAPLISLPAMAAGTQPEWLGKDVLRNLGVALPAGGLAHTEDQAVSIAREIGFPVVAKAQAAALAHKTDAGGVILRIADEQELRRAWVRLHENIRRAKPDLKLNGVLIERMISSGLELVVGARRDPQWGPVLLLGMGGIWIEVLKDVRTVPIDATPDQILEELSRLKCARLFEGYRGAPPVDLAAVAQVATAVGRLMAIAPQVAEIDINPLVVLPRGEGAVALDALVVVSA